MHIPTENISSSSYDLFARRNRKEIERQAEIISKLSIVDIMSEHNTDFVGILNSTRQFVFVNTRNLQTSSSLTSLLGMRPGEIIGCVHAGDSGFGCGASESCAYCDVVKTITDTILTGKKASREGRILVTQTGKTESLDVRINTSPIEEQGESFVILHIQDISLEKRMQIMERLFYHDIYNTIASLSSIINLSEIQSDDIPEAGEMLLTGLNDITEQIEYQRLLKNLEHNGDMGDQPVTEISEIIETFITGINNELFLDGRRLSVNLHKDPAWVLGKPVILRRILLNLIKNAKEASEPGDVIGFETSLNEKNIQIRVRNPQYMPPEVQAGVFQHSFSTKGSGRGYGTYSIKLFSQQYLNGDTSFSSSPEDGTVFTLTVPLYRD